ncbi:MAG: hypothetical protein ACK52I_29335 [Pseudomonadota bacterium]
MSATLPFDVFHRLIRQALGESGRAESLDLQVFTAEDVPGAAVVKFFPEELAESLHAVYVPAGLDDDGSVIERLHAAVATHDGLVPVADAARQRALLGEVRGLLERYLQATDGDARHADLADAADLESGDFAARGQRDDADLDAEDAEDAEAIDAGPAPARIEFGPLEALQALATAQTAGAIAALAQSVSDDHGGLPASVRDAADQQAGAEASAVAAASAAGAAAEAAQAPDDFGPDERVSFRALALDVLSGVPQPHGSAPDLPDSYEVWAYRHDPTATVVLRLFDDGHAAVLGALAPDEEAFDAGRFFGAAYRLLASRMPEAIVGGRDGRLSDLEPLDVAAAMARLGRALGLEHTADVRELTTNLLGEASAETLAAYEEIRLLDPRAEEGAAVRFAAIAGEIVELGGEALWTHRKERAGAPRIEVLEHRDHAGALLLVDFGTDADPVEVAGYLPGDGEAPEGFVADARRLLEQRAIFAAPRPLAEGGPFRRVANSRAVHAVETALDALEAGEGRAVAFRDPRTG